MRDFADAVLNGGLLICAAMILVWLLRLRSQGARAYVMALAFACLGGLILAYRSGATGLQWGLAAGLVGLLIADVLIKAARQARRAEP
jgi:hypothetical protein